jgi:uncharacterized membrane protein YeiH
MVSEPYSGHRWSTTLPTTNALNGALLSQRPNYCKGRQWTVIGIILFAIVVGIGGGVTRDVLLNKIPGALTDPWYLILCVVAGIVGMLISYKFLIDITAGNSAKLFVAGEWFVGVAALTAIVFLVCTKLGAGV